MVNEIEKEIKEKIENGSTAEKISMGITAPLTVPIIAPIAGAKKIIDKAPDISRSLALKRYNPLFPDQYNDVNFGLPNIITIVDSSIRKNIEVCKGAIGWMSRQSNLDILHLYNEAVAEKELAFLPTASIGSVYYADPHNAKRYICVDDMFDIFQKQKLAELVNIAYCLGAKTYSIEIVEEENESKKISGKTKTSANVKFAEAGDSSQYDSSMNIKAKRRFYTEEKYKKRRNPIEPELCWFKDDANIVGMIKQICYGKKSIQSKILILEGSKYAGMSKQMATNVQAAVKKIGAKISTDIKENIEKEYASKMIFKLEF